MLFLLNACEGTSSTISDEDHTMLDTGITSKEVQVILNEEDFEIKEIF